MILYLYLSGRVNQPIEHIIELQAPKEFLLKARQYCAFVESTTTAKEEFLRETQGLLLNLYQLATILPWTTLNYDVDFNEQLSNEEYEKTLTAIAEKIGSNRFYWEVFDPTKQEDTEAVAGDLVDDLGDIYRDLKYNLMIFDIGTMASQESAMWDFKFGFETHWGRHAIGALKTIHFLLGMS